MATTNSVNTLKGHSVTIEDVKKNEKIKKVIEKSDKFLEVMGYTEHGNRHCSLAAHISQNIMLRLGKSEHRAQLAAIAAYMHDMGNVVTRDFHDRVNYAATSSFLRVEEEKKTIALEITIDTTISSVMEYFEIFLSRMIVCRRAAEFLGMRFELEINGSKLL